MGARSCVLSVLACFAGSCDAASDPGGGVEIVSGPAALANESEARFTLGCENAECELECALDGEAFAPCGTTVTYPDIADGAHRFAARTTGDPTEVTATWTVDTVAPAVSITSAPAAITSVTGGTVVFSCADAGCVLECALDGVTTACGSPWQIAPQLDGDHTARIRGRDSAGNVATATAVWRVDTIDPIASFAAVPPDPMRQTASSHSLACNDAPCTFTCSFDGEPYTACASPVVQRDVSDGSHRLDVRATDAAGNTGAPITDTWLVDTLASHDELGAAERR